MKYELSEKQVKLLVQAIGTVSFTGVDTASVLVSTHQALHSPIVEEKPLT